MRIEPPVSFTIAVAVPVAVSISVVPVAISLSVPVPLPVAIAVTVHRIDCEDGGREGVRVIGGGGGGGGEAGQKEMCRLRDLMVGGSGWLDARVG